MCIKMMYNITMFKNVFQYQMAQFNNAKPQIFLPKPTVTLIDRHRAYDKSQHSFIIKIQSGYKGKVPQYNKEHIKLFLKL